MADPGSRYPTPALSEVSIRAVANGFVVYPASRGFRMGEDRECFVFSTPAEVAEWIAAQAWQFTTAAGGANG